MTEVRVIFDFPDGTEVEESYRVSPRLKGRALLNNIDRKAQNHPGEWSGWRLLEIREEQATA